MALVQISDLVFGASFNESVINESIRLNAFAAAGVVVRDANLDAAAEGRGFITTVPRWNQLANDEPNASSDSAGDVAVPKKIGQDSQSTRKLFRNQGWSVARLTAALNAADPLAVISNMIATYWAGVNQTTIIKMALGVLADNVANDGGDMLVKVGTDASGAATDAERFNLNTVIDAQQTLGDHKGQLAVIAVHSVVHARMQKLGALIDQFDPETGRLLYQSFLGLRVVVDDDMPVTQGTNRKLYTCILFAAGAFGQGFGTPDLPTEIDSVAAQGNGEGVKTLWNRRHEILHPAGFSVIGDALTSSVTPSYSVMASAAMWNRVDSRKLVPMAFIQVND